VCVRAALSNQSVIERGMIERGIGSFYTPDQLPLPLIMSGGQTAYVRWLRSRSTATAPYVPT
jgi:hypothetical protein